MTIKSAFLQTDEEKGQVKEDLINATDVAVVLPENQSTKQRVPKPYFLIIRIKPEAFEKQIVTTSSESQQQTASNTASTAIESTP